MSQPPVGEGVRALLHRVIQDLVHPGHVGAGADHGGQVLQGALQGVVQPGDHQQEQEEGEHVQAALHQQQGARQGHRGDAQLEDQGGGHHKGGQAELVDDAPPLHRPDLLLQPRQVGPLGVVGAEIPHRLDALLDAVGAGHPGVHGLLVQLLLHPGGAGHDGEGHGQHPQGRQGMRQSMQNSPAATRVVEQMAPASSGQSGEKLCSRRCSRP